MTPYDSWLAKIAKLKPDAKLRSHQQAAVDRTLANDGALLIAHPTGSGKTMSSVAAIEALRGKGKITRTLAITPAALRDNFIDAGVKKYTDQSAVRLGTRGEKGSYHIDGKLPAASYYVTSLEAFRKDPRKYLKATGADSVVWDELHKARDPGTGTYQAMMAVRPHVKAFIGLTGSPIMNHPRDIGPLLDIVSNRQHHLVPHGTSAQDAYNRPSMFKSKGLFDRMYTRQVEKHHGPLGFLGWGPSETETHLKNTGRLAREVGKWTHYVPPEAIPDLPTKHVETKEVEMSREQQKLYHFALDSSGLDAYTRWKIRRGLPLGTREATSILPKLTQARQVSNALHPLSRDHDAANHHTPKVKALLDDLDAHLKENPKHQAIASSYFVRGGIDVLQAGLRERGHDPAIFVGSKYQTKKDRDAEVEAFKSGHKRVILLNSAAQEGLDLPMATHHFMLDEHWNPEASAQLSARGARASNPLKDYPITKYRSVPRRLHLGAIPLGPAEHGVDERVARVAERKDRLNQEFLGLLSKQKAAALAKFPVECSAYDAFFARHGRDAGVSLRRDAKGFFVTTHRARSKSYPDAGKIPAGVVRQIESTG